ncbi:MAG TPA: hypothetical protein VEB65_09525 [Solirubrobacterales bacterium]|nr:hypothetical protein [Solirubrobacterales bacterium]
MRTKGGQSRDEAERRLEREVLALALVEHPVRLTLEEARRTLGRPIELERAVAALVGAGLLSVEGEEIFPTPAAVRFNEIEPIEPPKT